MTDSSTGGYLVQVDTPTTAQDWDNALTSALVGITGMSSHLVFPRWQAEPPNQPAADVNWASIGITSRTPEDYPYQSPPDTITGTVTQTRWFTLNALASFYGPDCDILCEQFRDGLYIPQNLYQLSFSGIKLREVSETTKVPDLVNAQWIDHVDLPIVFAAVVTREYAILDILSSEGTITIDTPIQIEQIWEVNN